MRIFMRDFMLLGMVPEVCSAVVSDTVNAAFKIYRATLVK